MAKPADLKGELLVVLLASKSELWQSHRDRLDDADLVLLASKSELWQSKCKHRVFFKFVLLASKSELWQSRRDDGVLAVEFCSHRNLNYGKASDNPDDSPWEFCSHRNLNYGKADKILAIGDNGYNQLCHSMQIASYQRSMQVLYHKFL